MDISICTPDKRLKKKSPNERDDGVIGNKKFYTTMTNHRIELNKNVLTKQTY